jgi:hypothetical protein
MKKISHGYSQSANPRRGYHDQVLVMEFDEDDTPEQREGAKKALLALYKPDGGPTWCHVERFDEKQLVIRHGYDSGD